MPYSTPHFIIFIQKELQYITMIYLYIILIYIFFVFIFLRLIVPYSGFVEIKDYSPIPPKFINDIEKIYLKYPDNYDYLQNCYKYMTSKYYGSRYKIFTQYWKAFEKPFKYDHGFLPCNILNAQLIAILLYINKFKKQDIHTKMTFLNFFIHQFIEVKVGNNWVKIDPSYKTYGVPFGKSATLFK